MRARKEGIGQQLMDAHQLLLDHSFLHNGVRLVFSPLRILKLRFPSETRANSIMQRLKRRKIIRPPELGLAEIAKLEQSLGGRDQTNARLWEVADDIGLPSPQKDARAHQSIILGFEITQLILELISSSVTREALSGVNRAIEILSHQGETLSARAKSELSKIGQSLQQIFRSTKNIEVRTATSLAFTLIAEVAGIEVDHDELRQIWRRYKESKGRRISSLAGAVAVQRLGQEEEEDEPFEL